MSGVIGSGAPLDWGAHRQRHMHATRKEVRFHMKNAQEINDTTAQMRSRVREALDGFTSRRALIDSQPDWKREPDAERKLNADREQYVEQVKLAATSAIATARKVVTSAEERHREAIREQARGADNRRARDLAEALRARMALARPSVTGQDTRVRELARAIDEAEISGDAALARAVRMVAADTLDRPTTEPALVDQLARRLADLPDPERAVIAVAEGELVDAKIAADALRREILAAETLLTGAGSSIFGGGWARDVLGEHIDAFTGDVVIEEVEVA